MDVCALPACAGSPWLSRTSSSNAADLERRIRETEGRARNVTEALAKIGYSEALLEQLRIEEARLATLKADQAARRPRPIRPLVVPPERIQGYIGNLVGVLETDPARGRERLGRHLAQVVMTPEGEGPSRTYRATGAFNLLLSSSSSTKKHQESRVASALARVHWNPREFGQEMDKVSGGSQLAVELTTACSLGFIVERSVFVGEIDEADGLPNVPVPEPPICRQRFTPMSVALGSEPGRSASHLTSRTPDLCAPGVLR
jgi:hypothetical protein